MVAEQLRQLGITPQAIVLEPVGRNTAPAVAIAALAAGGASSPATTRCCWSCRPITCIRDVAAFHAAVALALEPQPTRAGS